MGQLRQLGHTLWYSKDEVTGSVIFRVTNL